MSCPYVSGVTSVITTGEGGTECRRCEYEGKYVT